MLGEFLGKRVDVRIEAGSHRLQALAGRIVRGKVLAVGSGGAPLHPPRAFVEPEPTAGQGPGEILLRLDFDASPEPTLDRLRAAPTPVRIALFGASGHKKLGEGTGSLTLAPDAADGR